MKAKLVKKKGGWYNLYDGEIGIGSTHSELQGHKLSVNNCDEIFGLVDVKKLAKKYLDSRYDNEDIAHPELYEEYNSFINGFNEAMVMNKGKVFNEYEVLSVVNQVLTDLVMVEGFDKEYLFPEMIYYEVMSRTWAIKNEVKVGIVMKNSRTGKIVESESDLEWDEEGLCDESVPNLDSEGCLILKKI
jgi:hypothetical protein